MNNLEKTALKSLFLLDLTSLDYNDTKESIKALCDKAVNKYGSVASVCIYPAYIKYAKDFLKKTNVKITTVVNFPEGGRDIPPVIKSTNDALKDGCDEFDLVIPYNDYMNGNKAIVFDMVSSIRKQLPNNILKVIIESGVLKKTSYIKECSKIAIDAGADFIKTSTGKTEISATLPAANAMLEVIKESGKNVGFKAAGGIKTVAVAADYLKLAKTIMGEDFITKKTFRFGASSMLGDILQIIDNKQ